MSTKTLLTSEDIWKIVANGSRYEPSEPRPQGSGGFRGTGATAFSRARLGTLPL